MYSVLQLLIASVAFHALGSAKLQTTNAQTSLTFLYQNNLNASDGLNHRGAILLEPMTAAAGQKACSAISENLLSPHEVRQYETDYSHALAYLEYANYEASGQRYHLAKGSIAASESGKLTFMSSGSNAVLPVLCTQSSLENLPPNSTATAKNMISIQSNGNTFIGFRNLLSFRFNGIPFADPAKRFEYSTVYSKTSQTIKATAYGSDCAQIDDPGSAEDCLFLNIQTPYIPKAGSTENLRPVVSTKYKRFGRRHVLSSSFAPIAYEHIWRRIYRWQQWS